jgi:CO/xanthine dehydrogenase FAD-binding subunit
VAGIRWYFPQNLDEVADILSRQNVIPHGGGTGILWGGLTRIRGLMDVSRLDLKFARSQDGSIDMGAALSYREAAEALAESGHLLARSLGSAATTPLRNRISLGGSIAMFPYWSDLMGPLLALDAELTLAGASSGTWPLAEYLSDRSLRQSTLITSIRLPPAPWQGAYYRHTRTIADRPAFSITVLLRQTARRVEEIRVVVVGCSGRYRRLTEVENLLRGASVPSEPAALLEEAAARMSIDFPSRMGFSAEYLQTCAMTELTRALASALRSTPGSTSPTAPGSPP